MSLYLAYILVLRSVKSSKSFHIALTRPLIGGGTGGLGGGGAAWSKQVYFPRFSPTGFSRVVGG